MTPIRLRFVDKLYSALRRLLERFPGTVLFVSHDRYFLDRIADRIVEVREGELRGYPGGYSDWRSAAGRRAIRPH